MYNMQSYNKNVNKQLIILKNYKKNFKLNISF